MSGPKEALAAALKVYQHASMAVMDDPSVWDEEGSSSEQRVLAWPRPYEGTQHRRLLAVLFNADVDVVLVLLKDREDPRCPTWLPSVNDPAMQVLLRVVQRGAEAGDAALVKAFGGLELTGKRAFSNMVTDQLADMAVASGLPRREAFDALGIGQRQGFRARARANKPKK